MYLCVKQIVQNIKQLTNFDKSYHIILLTCELNFTMHYLIKITISCF